MTRNIFPAESIDYLHALVVRSWQSQHILDSSNTICTAKIGHNHSRRPLARKRVSPAEDYFTHGAIFGTVTPGGIFHNRGTQRQYEIAELGFSETFNPVDGLCIVFVGKATSTASAYYCKKMTDTSVRHSLDLKSGNLKRPGLLRCNRTRPRHRLAIPKCVGQKPEIRTRQKYLLQDR